MKEITSILKYSKIIVVFVNDSITEYIKADSNLDAFFTNNSSSKGEKSSRKIKKLFSAKSILVNKISSSCIFSNYSFLITQLSVKRKILFINNFFFNMLEYKSNDLVFEKNDILLTSENLNKFRNSIATPNKCKDIKLFQINRLENQGTIEQQNLRLSVC